MGLGHEAATAAADRVLARPGVHGAAVEAERAGGTVVVVSERHADDIEALVR